MRLSIVGYSDVHGFVVVLLNLIGPAAIAGLVPFVVVYTVDTSSARPFAHVGKEVLEFLPTLAYRNTSAKVVFPVGRGSCRAATNHVLP
jgi:hypothetical protein